MARRWSPKPWTVVLECPAMARRWSPKPWTVVLECSAMARRWSPKPGTQPTTCHSYSVLWFWNAQQWSGDGAQSPELSLLPLLHFNIKAYMLQCSSGSFPCLGNKKQNQYRKAEDTENTEKRRKYFNVIMSVVLCRISARMIQSYRLLELLSDCNERLWLYVFHIKRYKENWLFKMVGAFIVWLGVKHQITYYLLLVL